MFLLALIWIPFLLWLTYTWFGWFGPLISISLVAWFFWKSNKDAQERRTVMNQRAKIEEARSKNPQGYRKPKVPRDGTRSGPYRSPYSNWRTVAKREKFICHICGFKVDDNDFTRTDSGRFVAGPTYPTVDHLVPQSKGGSHHWTNLKLAHKHCNSRKSNRDEWDDIDPFDIEP